MQREEQSLPQWGDDPLSTFMRDGDFNERATALNFPDVYEVLKGAHALLACVCEVLEKDPADRHVGAPRLLVARSRSAVLAAVRAAMSGQGLEAQSPLRLSIECAWYALHIAKDPAPPARAKIWWGRGDDAKATQACKDEFTVGNVRRTHEQLDPATAAVMHRLYEGMIDFGGHPNQAGVAGSLALDKSTSTAKVGILHPGTALQLGALKGAVDVAVSVAKTCRLIYPERFRIAEVDEQIAGLPKLSAEVFPKYAEAVRTGALK